MEFTNPKGVVAPASHYSQLVTVPANARRAIASGQIGIAPDGSICEGLEAQTVQAFENLFKVIEGAGMTKTDIVKIVFYSTVPGSVASFREIRDRMFDSLHLSGNIRPGDARLPLRGRGRGRRALTGVTIGGRLGD